MISRIQPTATPFRQPIVTFSSNCPESDHDSVHSPTNALSVNKTPSSSQMLVPVPSMDLLALVPRRKLRQSELSQRRIRRPFSVAEVEALVEAVEKLGTGRSVLVAPLSIITLFHPVFLYESMAYFLQMARR